MHTGTGLAWPFRAECRCTLPATPCCQTLSIMEIAIRFVIRGQSTDLAVSNAIAFGQEGEHSRQGLEVTGLKAVGRSEPVTGEVRMHLGRTQLDLCCVVKGSFIEARWLEV